MQRVKFITSYKYTGVTHRDERKYAFNAPKGRHCEEPSGDVAIRTPLPHCDNEHCKGERIATTSLRTGLAMTRRRSSIFIAMTLKESYSFVTMGWCMDNSYFIIYNL